MGRPEPREDGETALLLETFRALRAELVARIVLQNLLLAGIVATSLATAVGIAFLPGQSAWIATCQVIASGAAGLMWLHGGARTLQISTYLTEVIETRLLGRPGLGWESWHHDRRFRGMLGSRWFVSTVGVILSSQLLVMVAAVVSSGGSALGSLLVGAVPAWILTALLLRHPRLETPR